MAKELGYVFPPNDLFSIIEPDPVGQILDTGFNRFRSDRFRMNGLCKITDTGIELLALYADCPGQGDFGRFLTECRNVFAEIQVLHVDNKRLESYLARRGFSWTQRYERGELITGMIWINPAGCAIVIN